MEKLKTNVMWQIEIKRIVTPKKEIFFTISQGIIEGFFKVVLLVVLAGFMLTPNVPDEVSKKEIAQFNMLPVESSKTPLIKPEPVVVESVPKFKRIIPKFNTKEKKRDSVYIRRFQKVAISEMEKYNIPASISMAQGLLESAAGQSLLAKQNNNNVLLDTIAIL